MSHLPPKHAAEHAGRRIVALALFIAGGLLAAEPNETHHVKAVRFWTLGDITRIAVETDGAFQVRSARLENPDRLFFDLVGTQPSLGEKNLTVIPVSDHLVRQIRVAETQRNVTRIVLDLEGPAVATTPPLDTHNRLDIVPAVKTQTLPQERARKEPIELRLFNPPPPAQSEPAKPVQVALLDPP